MSKTIKLHIEVEVTVPDNVSLESVLETPFDYIDDYYNSTYLGCDGYITGETPCKHINYSAR
jgi:hypothetical protein